MYLEERFVQYMQMKDYFHIKSIFGFQFLSASIGLYP